AGAVATIVAFLVDARHTFFAYLMAYATVFSIAAGALVLVLIGNAARSRWFLLFRRTSEALAATLVVLIVLFIPILFGLSEVYPWARAVLPPDAREAHALAHQKPFLNPAFFAVRSAIYFAVVILAFAVLRRWSLRQDADSDPVLGWRQRAFAAVALPPVAFA